MNWPAFSPVEPRTAGWVNCCSILMSAVFLIFVGSLAVANTLVVAEVHAGDLIEFDGGWKTRITGVKAPETEQPLGREVHDFSRRQLHAKRVAVFTLTTDNTAAGIVRGDDGLPRAQIMFGKGLSEDFGALLISKGYARVDGSTLPEELEHYRELEGKARAATIGIWG